MNNDFLDLIQKLALKMIFIFTKPFKELKIKKTQKDLLITKYEKTNENLIIFLTSGYDMVNGGILSINSIYDETKKLKDLHQSEVILCTVPGEPLLLKYTKFKNQNWIYNFSDILLHFKDLKCLMIHIPEYACGNFLRSISNREQSILNHIENLHVNILIQNIDIAMDNFKDIQNLKNRFEKVTCTTAHENYSNIRNRQKFDIPLHKLSVYASPEQYIYKTYDEKKELIIISHDEHPKKKKVLKSLQEEFPNIKIQIIKNMTYNEFKTTISEAKWALTFGEGLDGYFVETIFSGGISFSVYNHRFFTKDFSSLETVYSDYDELIQKMPLDLRRLNKKNAFEIYQKKQFMLCSKYYDHKEYIKNLKLFYQGDYTYK